MYNFPSLFSVFTRKEQKFVQENRGIGDLRERSGRTGMECGNETALEQKSKLIYRLVLFIPLGNTAKTRCNNER